MIEGTTLELGVSGDKIVLVNPEVLSDNDLVKLASSLTQKGFAFDTESLLEFLYKRVFIQPEISFVIKEVLGLSGVKDTYSADQIKTDTEKAVELYGLTKDVSKAGYLLTDGRILDFSEDGGYTRTLDHRDVGRILTTDSDDQTDYLIQFMRYGHIRMMENGLDLMFNPTNRQRTALMSILKDFFHRGQYCYVDISDIRGNEVKTFDYHCSTRPGKVINDLREYFEGD